MTRLAFFASAVGAVALLHAAPAAADYTIEEDAAFPSVIYVNFDSDSMPKVIMAPSARDYGLSVINGGQVQQTGVGAPDPTSPDLQSDDQAADTNKDSSSSSDNGGDDDTASVTPLEQRIDQRVEELSRNQDKVEDLMIDREVEDRLLEETDRLLR